MIQDKHVFLNDITDLFQLREVDSHESREHYTIITTK